ncbi:DMT family transporter [Ruicaihuangia caeni]|uniref:SMR family transporter n=1 Tax=Ruicaihuangia caeni TaxID=3042517 RepID=A0AAW6T5F1_9MICO|nr:SMR family transporter [Klugiella sp. YN-L-19]MDI2098684.1 SMR family transporter [Klugiella sp. YN-L-19]
MRSRGTAAPLKRWLLLSAAILTEVVGTLALRATVDDAVWMPVVIVTYAAAFVLLGLALRAGMPVGIAYGIWGACGVALTAVLAAVLFDELLSGPAIVGILLIIVGVVVVEMGSHPLRRASTPKTELAAEPDEGAA